MKNDQFCPRTEESWCKYWKGDKSFKPSVNLAIPIMDILKKTFMDLRADDLFSRCLDGATQNPNEAFNQFIWQKCPKNIFVTNKILSIGVASSVVNYNEGLRGIQKILNEMGIESGSFMALETWRKDTERVRTRKSTVEQKLNRKKIRAVRKGYIDKEKETETGDSNESGKF